ncbi:hypothetical protein [Paenibacillus soyae]|uniref:Uncharacterized protein n=1 Tax=Paenibacillus soyae TaxID=2969249 RepID=A0A9X2MPX0_9BACL|nr:hypothetical protein [Paenibacillus soyae]MCR2804044.1 hypothetical protein [Paenibacillus soyae]
MKKDYKALLEPLCGKRIEVSIEDLAGQDPVAPPRGFELVRVHLETSGGGTYLKCYLSLTQHVSIPVFEDAGTYLEESPGMVRLVSEDRGTQLRYTVSGLV